MKNEQTETEFFILYPHEWYEFHMKSNKVIRGRLQGLSIYNNIDVCFVINDDIKSTLIIQKDVKEIKSIKS